MPEAIIPRDELVREQSSEIVFSYCSMLFPYGLYSGGIRAGKGVVASDPFDFPQKFLSEPQKILRKRSDVGVWDPYISGSNLQERFEEKLK